MWPTLVRGLLWRVHCWNSSFIITLLISSCKFPMIAITLGLKLYLTLVKACFWSTPPASSLVPFLLYVSSSIAFVPCKTLIWWIENKIKTLLARWNFDKLPLYRLDSYFGICRSPNVYSPTEVLRPRASFRAGTAERFFAGLDDSWEYDWVGVGVPLSSLVHNVYCCFFFWWSRSEEWLPSETAAPCGLSTSSGIRTLRRVIGRCYP